LETHVTILKSRLDEANLEKLLAVPNEHVHRFIADAIELCNPSSVFVVTDDPDDINRVRRMAIETGEEAVLATEGHTIHYDGLHDQARDKARTRYLVPEGETLGKNLRQIERKKGLAEVKGFLKNSMNGKEMAIRFFCLGPINSIFSIPCIQLTDSYYVAHSEDILYRSGYEYFKSIGNKNDFFRFLHSASRLDRFVSVDIKWRRVYIDYIDDTVYITNTQYAGNTVGFKKLALRLAIRKANREGWLAEHMFIMKVLGPEGRRSYFTGAFPSGCGKTSTSMVKGETIIGDDLAYLRHHKGEVYAANVESGIFGIIRSVNSDDDPVIWNVLNRPGEVIFSNVLIANGTPYWIGDGREVPEEGINYSGNWFKGKTDKKGNEIRHSHKNARYTIKLSELDNLDPKADDPEGVPLHGIIYGGRDPDTWVPVQQSFNWAHGALTMGACLESESTAATLGAEGIRTYQPFANLDFISIPLGRYIQNHLDFVKGLNKVPKIFSVNYFLRDKEGNYLNGKQAKRVWLKWMELRVHEEVGALTTPTGYIPKYDDLKRLFKSVLNQDYKKEDYEQQFEIEVTELLAKIRRIRKKYRASVPDAPDILYRLLNAQKYRLLAARAQFGDSIRPSLFEDED
jgi:phosphoenolpyruvate carboxykinase (GTP)